MRVVVQGELYALVPQKFLNVLWVRTSSLQQRRAGVPEIVEAMGRASAKRR